MEQVLAAEFTVQSDENSVEREKETKHCIEISVPGTPEFANEKP